VEEASEQVVAAFVLLVKGDVWGNLSTLIGYFQTGCFQTFRFVTWASSGILFSVMKKRAKWLTFFLLKLSPKTATYAMLAVARLLLVLRFVGARFVLNGSTGF
jgi:hypothetical protein